MKKLLIAVGVVVVIGVVASVFLISNVDKIIKKAVETVGPKVLQAPVDLDDVSISLSSGSGELKGLTIGNPQGYDTEYAFQLGGVAIDLDLESLTSDKIHIKNIVISAPKIIYEGGLTRKNNLSQLQANAESFAGPSSQKTETTEKEPAGSSKKIQIDYFKIEGGNIKAVLDEYKEKDLSYALPTIELKNIGKDRETTVSEVIKLVLNAVNKAALPAVQKAVTNNMKDSLKGDLKETNPERPG